MPTKTLLHRSTHITTLRYTPDASQTSLSSSTRLYNTTLPYDSDNEPLLQPTQSPPLLLTTSSSRQSQPPNPQSKSPLSSLASHSLLAPPLLPIQTPTSDTIIPAIIVNVIPSPALYPPKPKTKARNLLGKIGRGKEEDAEKGITKVAFMPRKEYLKYFARGTAGEYIGTEPYRRWSEEELEREFGEFRPTCLRKGGRRK